jgi:hypothetical protein
LATAFALAWVACAQCSSSTAGGADSGSDAGGVSDAHDASTPTTDGDADTLLPDAEPGWRYLTELSPSCNIQVPLDPASMMHTLTWIACASQNPACERVDTSTWPGGPQRFQDVAVTGDAKWLSLRIRGTVPKTFDQVLYERASFKPINLWRVSSYGPCGAAAWPGVTTLTISGSMSGMGRFVATGAPPNVASAPMFKPIAPSLPNQPAELGASDTTIALDLQVTGGIIRFPAGSPTWTTPPQVTRLWSPIVVGDDVFAYHEYGNNNWSQLVRVDANGAVTVMRAVANRHVTKLKIHAGWMFWVELYGDANYLNFAQPKAEVWVAPYTTNPITLAQTAKKLAQVDGVHGETNPGVTFDGFYAVNGDPNGEWLYVVRASDGVTQSFDLNQIVQPGTQGVAPFFVSKDEVWGLAVQSTSDEIVKIHLNPWP